MENIIALLVNDDNFDEFCGTVGESLGVEADDVRSALTEFTLDTPKTKKASTKPKASPKGKPAPKGKAVPAKKAKKEVEQKPSPKATKKTVVKKETKPSPKAAKKAPAKKTVSKKEDVPKKGKKEETHKCERTINSKEGPKVCDKNARNNVDDKWYCGTENSGCYKVILTKTKSTKGAKKDVKSAKQKSQDKTTALVKKVVKEPVWSMTKKTIDGEEVYYNASNRIVLGLDKVAYAYLDKDDNLVPLTDKHKKILEAHNIEWQDAEFEDASDDAPPEDSEEGSEAGDAEEGSEEEGSVEEVEEGSGEAEEDSVEEAEEVGSEEDSAEEEVEDSVEEVEEEDYEYPDEDE